MIGSDSWINLPVGYNLNDHVGVSMHGDLGAGGSTSMLTRIVSKTDIEIAHPDVVFYDYYAAWNKPIPEDKDQYLSKAYSPLQK